MDILWLKTFFFITVFCVVKQDYRYLKKSYGKKVYLVLNIIQTNTLKMEFFL